MSMQPVDYERLIVRRLDGEISADESLELSRELLRNPDLRRMAEEYEQADALAATALRSSVAGDDIDSYRERIQPARTAAPGYWRPHRGWLLIPGAIAAALLALWVPRPDWQAGTGERGIAQHSTLDPEWQVPRPGIERSNPVDSSLMRTVGTTTKRDRGRELLGVIADDGNIYWIEVDRKRTLRVPSGAALRALGQF